MWKTGMPDDVILEELEAARSKDLRFRDGRIMASMCTEPLEIAREAQRRFVEANLGNPGLCSGTKELEWTVIHQLGKMLNGADTGGQMVSGGTEANITALWIARNSTGKKEVVFSRSAHFSFLKACDILGMKPVSVPLTDEYVIDIDKASRMVGPDTAAIVGIAGTTELGMIDPISELADICPNTAFLHVDAAFGGFVIPFLENMPPFDFAIPEVSTITIDPHKMGMSTIPSGALLIRDPGDIREIETLAPYLTLSRQTALSGTRASSSVAATYAAMRSLGREGYTKQARRCMENTHHAAELAKKLGLELVAEPMLNVLGVYTPVKPTIIREKMDACGWKISVASNPECMRLVIMPHVTKERIDELFTDLEDVLNEL